MWRTSLKNILELSRRKPVHLAFNVFALGASLAFFIVIAVYVFNEFSYDRHHTYAREGRMFRITMRLTEKLGTNVRGALTPPPFAPTIAKEFPDMVEAIARCRRKDTDVHYGSPIVQSEILAESEPRFYWADPSFFDVFTVRFLSGEPKTALVKPDTIVISRSAARKYFGETDPMGKVLKIDQNETYTVTGVYEDFAGNTHLHMDFIATLESVEDSRATYFIKNNYFTYVVLKPGVSAAAFDEKLRYLVAKYLDADLRKWLNFSLEDMTRNGNYLWFYAQPVTGIHLLRHDFEAEIGGSSLQTWILFWAAVAILVLSCINFMSLLAKLDAPDTAGLLGSRLSKTIVLGVAALVIAFAISLLLLPFAEELRSDGRRISLFQPILLLPVVMAIVIAALLIAALISLLLGKLGQTARGHLHAVWAVVLFAIASGVIVIWLTVGRQINFVTNMDLGFRQDEVLVLKEMDGLRERMSDFKTDLRSNPAIVAVSDSATLPGRQFRGKSHSRKLKHEAGDLLTLWQITTDAGFADTYGLKVREGRFFSLDKPDDIHGAVINETAARLLGLQLGTTIYEHSPGTPYEFKVIGIVEDFHVSSMRREIPAVTIKLLHYQPKRVGRFISVRIQEGQFDAALSHITSVWKKYLPERSLEFMAFKDEYGKLLTPDLTTFHLLSGFSLLSLLFACWSLPGVVLGSRFTSRWIISGVVLANLVGLPIGYWLAQRWLLGFFYRLEFSRWNLVISALATLVTAWVVTAALSRWSGRSTLVSDKTESLLQPESATPPSLNLSTPG